MSVFVVSEGCPAVEALCAGIATDKTLRLTGRFRAIMEIPAAADAAKPDVAVLDLSGAAGRAGESIRTLMMRCGAPVVALGGYAEEALASLDAGAADFVLLPSPGSDGDAACVLVSGSGMEGLERAAALGALAIAQNKNALLRSVGFKLPGGVLEMPLEDIPAAISPRTDLTD